MISHIYHLEPTLTCYLLGGAVSRAPPVASSVLWKHSAFFPVDDSCPGHGADFSEAFGGTTKHTQTHWWSRIQVCKGLHTFACTKRSHISRLGCSHHQQQLTGIERITLLGSVCGGTSVQGAWTDEEPPATAAARPGHVVACSGRHDGCTTE